MTGRVEYNMKPNDSITGLDIQQIMWEVSTSGKSKKRENEKIN